LPNTTSQTLVAPPLPFDVLLHGGTLISLLIYFFKDIKAIVVSFFKYGAEDGKEKRRLGLMIIVGSIPAGVLGIVFMDFFESLFTNIKIVPFMFLVTAVFLFVGEKKGKPKIEDDNDIKEVGIKEALIIGAFQAMALIPGISRSGSTIAIGLLLGLKKESAARFSFLLSIPAVFGAFILNLKHLDSFDISYLFGVFFAAGVGLLAIKLTIDAVVVNRLWVFSLYLAILGLTLITFNFLI